jgi:hypothetical protein
MPNDDETETVRNEERGCGFLKHGKAYVRSPPRSADGVLPSFVEFDPVVPYLERSKFRGYEYFPGTEFELSVTDWTNLPEDKETWIRPQPDDGIDEAAFNPISPEFEDGPETEFSTVPRGEVWRHIARTVGSASPYEHAGQIPQFQSRDLFMFVGKSYYETPEEFIEEVHEQGLSKAIPVSESQEPPRIDPGNTRLYLVHPRAVYYEETDTYKSGIIGYVYLHRTIYTEDEKGRFPAWAEKHASGREDMDLVRIGDQIYDDGIRATTINGVCSDDESPRSETESEPVSVQASDKPGRDVEEVPSDGLDEDAILDGLDEAEDEIREFAEETERVGEFYVEVKNDLSEFGISGWDEFRDAVEFVDLPPVEEFPDEPMRLQAASTELELRDSEYNDLRRRASSNDLNPGRNPSADDLVRVLLKDMGLL